MKFTFFLAFHKSLAILRKPRCKNCQSLRVHRTFYPPVSTQLHYHRHNCEPHDIILYHTYTISISEQKRHALSHTPLLPLPPPCLSIQQICNGIKGNPTDKMRKKEQLQPGRKRWTQRKRQPQGKWWWVFLFENAVFGRCSVARIKSRGTVLGYGTRVIHAPKVYRSRGPRRIQWIIQPRHN